MRTFLLTILILTFGACTMQKRHYRKGWTINWKTEKNSKTDISKTKDSLNFKDAESSMSTLNNDLNLSMEESVLAKDTILIASKKSISQSISLKTSSVKLEQKIIKPKIPLKISLPVDTEKVKTGEENYFILAFLAFFASIISFIIFAPQLLSSAGIENASSGKVIIVFFIALFLILMVVFIVLGFKKRRDFLKKSNHNTPKEQRSIDKENRRSKKSELNAAGIVNRAKLWLLFAGIIVLIAIAAILLIERGLEIAILAILPFLTFIIIAILENYRYKLNSIAYEHGEYDPEKFLNRTKSKPKKKKTE